MTRPGAAVLALVLAPACMGPDPLAGGLEVDLDDSVAGGYRSIPDGAPEPVAPPATETSIDPRLEIDTKGGDLAVREIGFPAIDRDAETIAIPLVWHLQLSSIPGALEMAWLSTEGGDASIVPVVDFDEHDLGDEGRIAPSAIAEARERAQSVNRRLARGLWHAMEPLPVELWDESEPGISESYKSERSPSDRGVQVLAIGDEIVARIAGVRVLERHGYSDEAWGHMVHRVYADRETGTVLVVMVHCAGDSCTCDPKFTATVTKWSPETFAVIDRRACHASATEDGESACDFRPLMFEEPIEPWDF